MAKLYALTSEYMQLQIMLEHGWETAEEEKAIIEAMEALAGDIEDKADGYARVLRNMTTDIEAIKAEEKRLYSRRVALENGVERLKASIKDAMTLLGKRRVETSIGSWGIQKNPPSVAITNKDAIPADYWIMPAPVLDKQALLRNLKDGEIIEGCELQQTEGVRFR